MSTAYEHIRHIGEGRVLGDSEQPRRAVKGLPCVGWYGVWCSWSAYWAGSWAARWLRVASPAPPVFGFRFSENSRLQFLQFALMFIENDKTYFPGGFLNPCSFLPALRGYSHGKRWPKDQGQKRLH